MSQTFGPYALEQLRRIRADIRHRSMFGGIGIYAGEYFFALIAEDVLYFKVDDGNRPTFVERGLRPFQPYGESGEVMQYYEIPEDVLENPETLGLWAEAAIEVARRKKAKRRPGGRA